MWVPERIGLRVGAGAADLIGSCASGRLGRPLGGPRGPGQSLKKLKKVDFEPFLPVEGYPGPPAPRRVLQQGPRGVPAKNLGFRVYTFTPPWEGPEGRHGGGSRPALPGLHDVLCRSRSSGSFGLRVAVVEPSAKTLGFRV